ncbi:MAG: hypothetical protein V3U84_07440 [Thiotrichaceae bacterium]
MTQHNPNKETIRRVCSIFKCEHCWLLNEGTLLSLLVDLSTEKLKLFKVELESWSGNQFDIYNLDSENNKIEAIKQSGQQLLPVEKGKPLEDIEKRRKNLIHTKKPTR